MLVFALRFSTRLKQIIALVGLCVACLSLALITISHFVVRTLADADVVTTRATLATAAAYFPHSAQLQARLAAVELAESMGEEDALKQAEAAALSAVRLSPWRSDNHFLLASVRNLQSDLDASEISMRTAVKLAPNYPQVHWLLANLLIRQDKVEEAFKEFQAAIALDPSSRFLPGAMDTVWTISEGNLDKLIAVVGNRPKDVLALAQYLLRQSRPTEATGLVKRIARQELVELPAAAEFVDALLSQKQVVLARDLWGYLTENENPSNALSNGSFEREASQKLTQFDWKISQSKFANLAIDSTLAHTGNNSLRIIFTGKDTTVLDREISQTVVVNPNVHYLLEYFAKTERLITTEGIRVVVADFASSTLLGTSTPITAGSTDWQSGTVDFVAPANTQAIVVTIKRTPKFSYDEPTKGKVWFDDFSLREKTR
ncbi:MAG: tetratricopeptide repeat protein [Acidobacteria bacterium]|nr:tetratricopeptide repeat protein [Acidobacteriota bacterium]